MLGVAAVQERQVRRIEAAFDALQPVALLDVARGEALFGGNLRPFEIREFRLELGRPHIGPHDLAALDAGIGARLELRLDARDRFVAHLRHAGDIDAGALNVELEAVIDAAQTALFVAAEEQRRGAVRTALVQKPNAAAGVAEKHEVLAQQPHADRRRVGFGDLMREGCGHPIAPHQFAHRRARAHAGQAFIVGA